MAELGEGVVFAGHRIEGVAGRGGMGTVYRATHLALDHMVALKVIAADLAGDESFRERFKSESRIAVSLRHPNVVPIHHAGEEDGLLFVTMDLIDGPDLRKLLIERERLEPGPAIAILEQVAAALDVAHARGLVHRDIKPGNILIEDRAGSDHAYLTDFGLTKRIDQASAATALTSTGAFVGTLDYVAPEQIRGDDLDARTDVYALGCVLYEMLAGRAPFSDREEKVAKMYAHLQDEPAPLGADRAAFDPVIARALAKRSDDRFPSAGDLARAAAAALGGGEVAEAERSVATGPAAPTAVHDSAPAAPGPEPAEPEPAEAAEPTEAEGPAAGTAAEASAPAEPTEAAAGPTEASSPPWEESEAAASAPTAGGPPAPSEPTAERSRAGEAEARPARPAAPAPARGGDRRRPLLIVGALAAVAAAIAAGILVLGGGEEEPQQRTTGGGNGGQAAVGEVGVSAEVPGFTFGLGFDDAASELAVSTRDGQVFRVDGDGGVGEPLTPAGGSRLEDLVVVDGDTYVAAPEQDAVIRIDADGSATPIPVGPRPQGLAAGAGAIWVANSGASSISRIGLGSESATTIELDGASRPHGIAVGEGAVWVTSRDTGEAIRVAIDASGAAGEQISQPVGSNPKGIAVAAGAVWVANTDDGTVSRLDPASGQPRGEAIRVGGEPRDVISGFGRVWVSKAGGEVAVLDRSDGGERGAVEVPGSPEELTVGDGSVWVTTGKDGGPNVVEIEP